MLQSCVLWLMRCWAEVSTPTTGSAGQAQLFITQLRTVGRQAEGPSWSGPSLGPAACSSFLCWRW